MTTVTIEGVNYSIPSGWDEITVKQYREIMNHSENFDPSRIINIFTGISYEYLYEFDQTSLAKIIYPLIEWMDDAPTVNDNTKEIIINNMVVEVPQDIGNESAGQNWVLQQMMNNAIIQSKKECDLITPTVALFIQPNYDKTDFNDKRLPVIEAMIDSCKLVDVYGIATFFLNKLYYYGNGKQISYTLNKMAKNYRQGLTNLMNLESSTRCTQLHGLIIQRSRALAS